MSDRVEAPASIDQLDLVDPARYAQRGYPDDVWTQLRAEAPVAWFEPEGYEPFWAITKHADIVDVASQATLFSNEASLLRLATAILVEVSEEWETGKRYVTF